jgi:hypothetical protein
LVGNNHGSDAMGVGVCFGNRCNHGHIDDNPEIDAGGREAVRLGITSLISNFNSFTINADSATAGEMLGIFAGDATGTILTARLGDASSGGGVSINPTSSFLFFIADNTTNIGADVVLHSLAVTPNAIAEPISLALLGTAIFSDRLDRPEAPEARWDDRKKTDTNTLQALDRMDCTLTVAGYACSVSTAD